MEGLNCRGKHSETCLGKEVHGSSLLYDGSGSQPSSDLLSHNRPESMTLEEPLVQRKIVVCISIREIAGTCTT